MGLNEFTRKKHGFLVMTTSIAAVIIGSGLGRGFEGNKEAQNNQRDSCGSQELCFYYNLEAIVISAQKPL